MAAKLTKPPSSELKKAASHTWVLPPEISAFYAPYKRPASSPLECQTKYNTQFMIDSHFEIVDCIGQGAYGIVAAIRDKRDDEFYAVKKVADVTSYGALFAKRMLREIRIMRLLQHENVLEI